MSTKNSRYLLFFNRSIILRVSKNISTEMIVMIYLFFNKLTISAGEFTEVVYSMPNG